MPQNKPVSNKDYIAGKGSKMEKFTGNINEYGRIFGDMGQGDTREMRVEAAGLTAEKKAYDSAKRNRIRMRGSNNPVKPAKISAAQAAKAMAGKEAASPMRKLLKIK